MNSESKTQCLKCYEYKESVEINEKGICVECHLKEIPKQSIVKQCRGCGCTEFNACKNSDGTSCSWIEDDLCSTCDIITKKLLDPNSWMLCTFKKMNKDGTYVQCENKVLKQNMNHSNQNNNYCISCQEVVDQINELRKQKAIKEYKDTILIKVEELLKVAKLLDNSVAIESLENVIKIIVTG